ncbi:MAG: hypothetical protein Q8M57_07285 [Nitrosomonas sp.]|nr:hypothetical protein [Nitrosomonas sp.]
MKIRRYQTSPLLKLGSLKDWKSQPGRPGAVYARHQHAQNARQQKDVARPTTRLIVRRQGVILHDNINHFLR